MRIVPHRPIDTDPRFWQRVPGRIYCNIDYSQFGSVSFTAGKIYASPIFIARSTKFDQLQNLVNFTGGTYHRMGIYDCRPDAIYPYRLLLDTGNIATSPAGYKATTIDIILGEGKLFFLAISSDTPPGLAQFASSSDIYGQMSFMGMEVANGSHSVNGMSFQISQAYGALPDPYPAGGILVANGNMVFLRVKA